MAIHKEVETGKTDKRRIQRLELIRNATRTLIETKGVNQVTLADIAKESGIPAPSLYHYYSHPSDIFLDLTNEVMFDFQELVKKDFPTNKIHHWTDIQTLIEYRYIEYYQKNKFARDLILGHHIYSNIHKVDLSNDLVLGDYILKIYDKFYHLPQLPTEYNIFSIALEVADKVYSMSHRERGNITDLMIDEAVKISHAYLGLYLPYYMQKKQSSID